MRLAALREQSLATAQRIKELIIMKLFLVGGFLGSGKTTAIGNAARLLVKEKKTLAVIANDQGSDLVDSAYFRSLGLTTEEIPNGCFCCNYPQLSDTILSIQKSQPDFIFAEAVGSCTDLIATVIKPLQEFNPGIPVVLSVFADASLLYSLITGNSLFLNDDVRYIFRKQLEEADIIVVNKIDIITLQERKKIGSFIQAQYRAKILFQNSYEIKDIQNWIESLHSYDTQQERLSLDVDYTRYGKGEAELGWVDQHITIHSSEYSAHQVAVKLVKSIFAEIKSNGLPIAHLKFLFDDGIKKQKLSITTIADLSGLHSLKDNRVEKSAMMINGRIQANAEQLEILVNEAIERIQNTTGSRITVHSKKAFQPAFPVPVYRM